MAKDGRTYSQKLLDPRWQKKRLEILNRDNWTCQYCGETKVTLHVHHEAYERGKEPWEAEDYLLTTLCKDCHDVYHLAKSPLEQFLLSAVRVRMDSEEIKMLNRVLKGIRW